ncbi:hypothetical protein ACKWTF_008747 [Chironomus riparius]
MRCTEKKFINHSQQIMLNSCNGFTASIRESHRASFIHINFYRTSFLMLTIIIIIIIISSYYDYISKPSSKFFALSLTDLLSVRKFSCFESSAANRCFHFQFSLLPSLDPSTSELLKQQQT